MCMEHCATVSCMGRTENIYMALGIWIQKAHEANNMSWNPLTLIACFTCRTRPFQACARGSRASGSCVTSTPWHTICCQANMKGCIVALPMKGGNIQATSTCYVYCMHLLGFPVHQKRRVGSTSWNAQLPGIVEVRKYRCAHTRATGVTSVPWACFQLRYRPCKRQKRCRHMCVS